MTKIIVVGGGPAGYTAAIRAAQLGGETVLIERNKPGGTCLNSGCIPTKALLQSSRLYREVASGAFGVAAEGAALDYGTVFARASGIVEKLGGGIQSLLKASGIKLINAQAELLSPSAVELTDGTVVEGDRIILATGARPVKPRIDGIELALTSDEVLSGRFSPPSSVTIIGGGVIGVEFATFFAEAGCAVTVIDALDGILSTLGGDIPKYLSMFLRKIGIKFILKASVKGLAKTASGIEVFFNEKDSDKSVSSDLALCCVGRAPNSVGGLERTAAVFDKGFVVGDEGRTAENSIYAVGDCVKGAVQLAHYASADAVRVVEGIFGGAVRRLCNIPSCVYSAPDAAVVGIRESQSERPVEVGRFVMAANGKTLTEGGAGGYIKAVFDKASTRLIGAEMVCSSAAEMAGFISNLINIGATREQILSSVYPHPSVSEGFYEAVADSAGISIHTIYRR